MGDPTASVIRAVADPVYPRGSIQDSTDHGLLATGVRAINAIPWVWHAAQRWLMHCTSR